MAELGAIVSVASVISHIIAFLAGVGFCVTVKVFIGKYTSKRDSSVTKQVKNVVGGDQAGRDIKK